MTRPTAVLLARLSWIIPVGAFFAGRILRAGPRETAPAGPREEGGAEGMACGLLLFYLAGLVVSVVALVASARHGPAGIRTPAIAGLAVNVVLLVLAVALMIRG